MDPNPVTSAAVNGAAAEDDALPPCLLQKVLSRAFVEESLGAVSSGSKSFPLFAKHVKALCDTDYKQAMDLKWTSLSLLVGSP